jgi:hypothetical protein
MNVTHMGLEFCLAKLSANAKDEFTNIIREVLVEVNLACQEGLVILNDFLLYDKLESGLLKLQKETINVFSFISEYLMMFAVIIRAKNIHLELNNCCGVNMNELNEMLSMALTNTTSATTNTTTTNNLVSDNNNSSVNGLQQLCFKKISSKNYNNNNSSTYSGKCVQGDDTIVADKAKMGQV